MGPDRARLLVAVVLGLVVVSGPIVAALVAGGTLDDWIPIYGAGGFGGLVFELMGNRWQLELPGGERPAKARANDTTNNTKTAAGPFDGDGLDLGFLGRIFTGGLAAVVTVMVVAAALAGDEGATDALTTAAGADLSIGWGLAAGAATRAVWNTVNRLVKDRLDATRQVLEDALTGLDAIPEADDSFGLATTDGAAPATPADGALAVIRAQLDAALHR